MKSVAVIGWLIVWLMAGQGMAQSGLKGEYYTGTNFEKKILTRIDPQIQFNWLDRSPAPGIPHSYYSIRWTGKLLAPATGEYYFYAKVDDGIRIWVGNQKVMDSWQLNDSKSFTGNIVLKAGQYYDLRVDYFNDMLEGEIYLYWQRPDRKRIIFDRFTTPGEPITGQYFSQKAPPAVALSKPKPAPPKTSPPVQPVAAAKPKPAVVSAKPVQRPVAIPPVSTRLPDVEKPVSTTTSAPTKSASLPSNEPVFTKGNTFVLHNVQFEQSSYILLPESSIELNQVVAALKANPDWHIDVAGHTDNVGDPRLNLALSEHRAKVVASYLTRCGIADDRISTKGYGGTHPAADNTTEGERHKNRRVEITIR